MKKGQRRNVTIDAKNIYVASVYLMTQESPMIARITNYSCLIIYVTHVATMKIAKCMSHSLHYY